MKLLIPAFALSFPISTLASDRIEPLIKKIKSNRTGNNIPKLSKWLYKGKVVYKVPSECCDIPSELFNEHGEKICTLGGGFANYIDKECEDFGKEEISKKLMEIPIQTNPKEKEEK